MMGDKSFAGAFDRLRGHRLTREQAEHLVSKVLAPCLVGSGVKIVLIETDPVRAPSAPDVHFISDAG